MIVIEKMKVYEGYGRHGRLSPKVFIVKVKYKKLGGSLPCLP